MVGLLPSKAQHIPKATNVGGDITRSSAFCFPPSSPQENPSTLSFLASPAPLSSFPFRFPPAHFIPSHPTICLVHLRALIQSPRSYHLASVPRLIYFGAAGFCAGWVGTPGNWLGFNFQTQEGRQGGFAGDVRCVETHHEGEIWTASPCFCLWIINGH